MGRPRKSTEDEWYDVFGRWTLADQKVAVKVLDRLVTEREKDERRASKSGEKREGGE